MVPNPDHEAAGAILALFRIALDEMRFVGAGLSRPECVLCTANGTIYASNRGGGVSWIRNDGVQGIIGKSDLLPNGIALMPDRTFLVANLSDAGGVWRLHPDGNIEPFLLEVDGVRLPGINFVHADDVGRIWVCVSTVRKGDNQYRNNVRDGFIILVDRGQARVVADDLCWTNECRVDPSGRYLYTNETFGRRLTRFTIGAGGKLSARETVTEFGFGDYPDGLAIDTEGGLWVVSVGSNRVIRVTPDGKRSIVLEDSDPVHLRELEDALQRHELTRPKLMDNRSAKLRNISSIAFGGPDLRTAYLGCLAGDSLACFRSPVAGVPPPHWRY